MKAIALHFFVAGHRVRSIMLVGNYCLGTDKHLFLGMLGSISNMSSDFLCSLVADLAGKKSNVIWCIVMVNTAFLECGTH